MVFKVDIWKKKVCHGHMFPWEMLYWSNTVTVLCIIVMWICLFKSTPKYTSLHSNTIFSFKVKELYLSFIIIGVMMAYQ